MSEKLFVALSSQKINVLIVGGGRAAYIKLKTFSTKGAQVFVVAKKFLSEFDEFKTMKNVHILKKNYEKKYIEKSHIIVIATDNAELNSTIREDCNNMNKLYIDCTKPSLGNCITPCQRNTKNIYFGVNTSEVSPKGAVFVADKMREYAEKYDDFIEFTFKMRRKMEGNKNRKIVMRFICSEDFYFFYQKGKAKTIIDMFYGK
ncbi:NAD(P)-dependent oxidoreductase [Clostridium sp. cel8]|uniref:NAD(P)-dependent oxidoreductase n=1 Tax=Clostridium sp. cel8 TaxID=2663123 RepID=UPI0015F76591|nr:NAD(P)-dependent oxidoreductase [Clostridium sp. cel8]MBA5850970.1 NAD(P)-dependent oxidoreductase [Clostridium sp. cel8]